MQSIKDLKERIQFLEAERAKLKIEVEDLRRAASNRAAALEADIAEMRNDVRALREFLVVPATDSARIQTDSNQGKLGSNITSRVNELNEEEVASISRETQPSSDSILESLTKDEIRVIELLQAHGGKYPQKQIRVEAKLSWLEANRVVSRLVERKVVFIEKNGSVETVVLANNLD